MTSRTKRPTRICPDCHTARLAPRFQFCATCRKAHKRATDSKRTTHVYWQRIADKRCTRCNALMIQASNKKCQDCLTASCQHSTARRERLKASGLCMYCGKLPALPSQAGCGVCSVVHQHYASRRRERVE